MTERWSLDFPTFLAAVRRRWWLIALVALVAAGLAYGISSLQPERYQASADLLFKPPEPPPRINPSEPPPNVPDAPERQAANNLALASADIVAARVRRRTGSRLSTEELRDRVELEPKGLADIVTVRATGDSAAEATAIANAFAREIIRLRRQRAQRQVQRVIAAIDRRLGELDPADSVAGHLQRRREQLTVERGLQTGDVELAEAAPTPRAPSSPKPLRNSAIGGLLGLLLGLGLVLAMQRLDRRVRDEDEVEQIVGAPTIARIPVRKNSEWERELFLESFHFLRANLQLREEARDCRTIVVTSAVPGSGKSTVAVGLSEALAASGSQVITIDCDLRRPTLHDYFETDSTRGVTDLIVGPASPAELLHSTGYAGVRLLPAGPSIPVSASVAASTRVAEVLSDLRDEADYVVIDTSPVTIGADASAVASAGDGVLLVVDVNTIDRHILSAAAEQLRSAGATLLGVVQNRAPVLLADQAYRGYYGAGARERSRPKGIRGLGRRDSAPAGPQGNGQSPASQAGHPGADPNEAPSGP